MSYCLQGSGMAAALKRCFVGDQRGIEKNDWAPYTTTVALFQS